MPKKLLILYLCLYLSMIGYGLSLPLVPFFLQELLALKDVTTTQLSIHVGAVTAIFAFMQMIFAPLWGRLSDKTGRRKFILLFGLSGYTLSLLLAGFSSSIIMLYGARMLNGVFSAAVLPIASAYIVDVSPSEFRARGLAWHGTSVGLGIVSGPAVASLVSELVNNHPIHFNYIDFNAFSAPFIMASVLSGFSVILAGVFLKESYPGENKKSVPAAGTNLLSSNESFVTSTLKTLLLLSFISQFGLSLFEGTFVLHAQNVMTITPVQLGYVFMVCGFVMAAGQGTVVAGLIERFGAPKVLPFGFVFMGVGLMLLMIGRSIGVILVFVGILAMGMAIITPSLAVIVSSNTVGQLGKSLGLLTGTTSLGQTLGPLLGSLLFIVNLHLPYLLSAAALLMAATFIFRQNSVAQE